MKTFEIFILLSLFISISNSCALPADDENGDESTYELPWSGETDKFTIDEKGIRLNDPQETAGTAYITTPSTSLRNTRWEFGIRLTFNPSANNYARFYLSSSSNILNGALNGYFIQIGGAKDNVALYRQEGKQPQLLASGRELMKGNSTPKLYIKVECDQNGYWTFWTRLETENDYIQEKQVQDTRITSSAYCGIHCIYTKSNCDGVTFHHIKISNGVPTTTVPGETPEEPDEPNNPEEPIFPDNVKNILLFNEVMYDNAANGAEYIELYNPSDAIVSMPELRFIRYVDDGQGSTITTKQAILRQPAGNNLIIQPHGYICFTKSANALIQRHKVDGKAIVEVSNFPAINNEGGYLAITTSETPPRIIDKCCYSDKMHTLKEREQGVSLEKKSPELSSVNANWHSSRNITGGTPGIRNGN